MRNQTDPRLFSPKSLVELDLEFLVKRFNQAPEKHLFIKIMNLPEELRERLVSKCHSMMVRVLVNNAELLTAYKSRLPQLEPYVDSIALIEEGTPLLPAEKLQALINSYSHGFFLKLLCEHTDFREKYLHYLPKNISIVFAFIEVIKTDDSFVKDNKAFADSCQYGIYQSEQNPALFIIKRRESVRGYADVHAADIKPPSAIYDHGTFEIDVLTLGLNVKSAHPARAIDLKDFLQVKTARAVNTLISTDPITVPSYGCKR